jgi:Dullard-like phosphatase family protein
MHVHFEDPPHHGDVHFRPYAQLFLEVVSKKFEVVVFTASQPAYADKVIDALDHGGNLISYRLYRQHCTELCGAFFKELGRLGRPVSQCILIDNSPISVACNPDNGILIRSWYGDPGDRELVEVLQILENAAQSYVDFGKYLSSRYGLLEFFSALRSGH